MEEEGEFDCWDWNAYYDLLPAPSAPEAAADGPPMPPPPLSSDGHLMMISADDGSWALDVQVLSTLGLGGDDIVPTAEDWIIHGLTDQHLSLLDDIGGSSSGTGGDVDSSDASADATTNQAQAEPCWGMDGSNDAVLEVGAGDSPPAAPATGQPAGSALPQGEEEGMTATLADMVRMAEECGNDEAARRVWSEEEHKELLNRIHGYAELDVDERARRCFHIAFYLPKKTAMDVALRWRWLQDKEKAAKQSEVVEKGSAAVKVKKRQGTKGAKKNSNMYPLSKEALHSKITTRELLRDGYIFMQRIEENIKAGEWGGNTADYFYYVKTIIDAVEKRGNEFCRISMPMPPIDEQGLEEILHESRHTSSASKEAAA